MAVGDNVLAHSSVAAAASLTIRPGAGAEWILNNIYMGGPWELYRTDGVNTILVDYGASAGSVQNRKIKCTNSIYYTLKNTHASVTYYYGYDGVIWK